MISASRTRTGFTLLEVIVALVIISLITSAAIINLANPLSEANHRNALSKIAEIDMQTRGIARSQGKPVDLVFDLSDNFIYRQNPATNERIASKIKLTGDAQITQLLVRGQSLTAGTMAIRCSRGGYMPTYALKIETPNTRPSWLLIAGPTGQVTELENESQIEKIWTQAILRRNSN